MAYRSNFAVKIHGGDEKTNTAILDTIQKDGGIPFDKKFTGHHRDDKDGYAYIEDTAWYNWRETLSGAARKYPEVTIQADVNGEDWDDEWKARFRGHDVEISEMKRTFPPFRRILLPGESLPVRKNHILRAVILIEVNYEGAPYPRLITGTAAEELTEKVIQALKRAEKRGFKVLYDERQITVFLSNGKNKRKPLEMAVEGWDNWFVLYKDNIKLP